MRVSVEQAIASLKRCPIVSDLFRNRKSGFVDEVMLVAIGLHNLRVAPAPFEHTRKAPQHALNTMAYEVYQ